MVTIKILQNRKNDKSNDDCCNLSCRFSGFIFSLSILPW